MGFPLRLLSKGPYGRVHAAVVLRTLKGPVLKTACRQALSKAIPQPDSAPVTCLSCVARLEGRKPYHHD